MKMMFLWPHGRDRNHFGFGKTQSDALGDFRAVLAELFVELEREGQDGLGPEPQRVLRTLREHLKYEPVEPL